MTQQGKPMAFGAWEGFAYYTSTSFLYSGFKTQQNSSSAFIQGLISTSYESYKTTKVILPKKAALHHFVWKFLHETM
jgi:hypothetical protein